MGLLTDHPWCSELDEVNSKDDQQDDVQQNDYHDVRTVGFDSRLSLLGLEIEI